MNTQPAPKTFPNLVNRCLQLESLNAELLSALEGLLAYAEEHTAYGSVGTGIMNKARKALRSAKGGK